MLAKLLEEDHGQQVRACPTPRRRVERCRRLADPLAVPASERLADGLDDPPLPGMTSSVSVMSSPIFTIRVDPQQVQVVGASITTRSRGRCSGNGLRTGRRRSNAAIVVFGAVASALALSSAMSTSSSSSCISSCSTSRAWCSALLPCCSRRSMAIWRRRCRIISSEAEITARVCVIAHAAADARASAAARAARGTAISEAASDMREPTTEAQNAPIKQSISCWLPCRSQSLRPVWVAPADAFKKIAELCRRDWNETGAGPYRSQVPAGPSAPSCSSRIACPSRPLQSGPSLRPERQPSRIRHGQQRRKMRRGQGSRNCHAPPVRQRDADPGIAASLRCLIR